MDILSKRETYCKTKCGLLKIHGAEYIDPLPNELPECTKARQEKIYKSINKAKSRKRRAEASPSQKNAARVQDTANVQRRRAEASPTQKNAARDKDMANAQRRRAEASPAQKNAARVQDTANVQRRRAKASPTQKNAARDKDTANAQRQRAEASPAQKSAARVKDTANAQKRRAKASPAQKNAARVKDTANAQKRRANESPMKRAATLENDKKRSQNKRDAETPEQKDRKRQRRQAVKDSQTQAEQDEKRLQGRLQRQQKRNELSQEERDAQNAARREKTQDTNAKNATAVFEYENLVGSSSDNNVTIQVDDIPDITKDIETEKSIKKALAFQRRSHLLGKDDEHSAPVCVICDCHIKGTEKIHRMTRKRILLNKSRLSVKGYEDFHGTLNPIVVEQYKLPGYEGMLLSPRSTLEEDAYQACSACFAATAPNKARKNPDKPPKFSIANGFVVGQIPNVIPSRIENKVTVLGKEEDGVVDDVMSAAISCQRPYGYVFGYSGGAHKSIVGHYSFFEMNQSHVSSVMNHFAETGANLNILCALCGRMTPRQKEIATQKAELNVGTYLDLMNWFISIAKHPAYHEKVTLPQEEDIQKPVLLPSPNNAHNTDEPMNPAVENRFEGGTYTFTSGLDPSAESGLHADSTQFALSMLNRTAPLLLVYGGTYVNAGRELKLENVMPIQFPFGTGGPTLKRRVQVSDITCLQYYLRHSLPQFKRGNFILVVNHLYNRVMSYESGIIMCRSGMFNGRSLSDQISSLTEREIRAAALKRDKNIEDNSVAGEFLRRINGSCRAIGYTKAAADAALRQMYALCDYNGFGDIFFSFTPCDECSFRVRLYAIPGQSHALPSLDGTDANCFVDFKMRQNARQTYPGACSLEYQSAVQILLEVLFGWDPKTRTGRKGIFGKLLAFAVGHEEQGRKTLHSHWTLWIQGFEIIKRYLFAHDLTLQQRARRMYLDYINKVMSVKYGEDIQIVPHCQQQANKITADNASAVANDTNDNDAAIYVKDHFYDFENGSNTAEQLQRLRDARSETKKNDVNGQILTCNDCGSLISTTDIVNMALQYHKEMAQSDVQLPMCDARHDIAAYRYTYDWGEDGLKANDSFWNDQQVRDILLQRRFNEHDWQHRKSCFKKGPECRHNLPTQSCAKTYIDLDYGDNNKNAMKWYTGFDEPPQEAFPYSIVLERPQGSQYLNTHNVPTSIVFSCNTNIQIGSPTHIFYATNYSFKDTQADDRERYLRIGTYVIRRLLRMKSNAIALNLDAERTGDDQETESNEPNFSEALSRILCGINANLSKAIVSSTLAHFIVTNDGSRFGYSHGFVPLLASQALDVLNNKEGNFRLRRNFNDDTKEVVLWPDSQLDDFRYRPDLLHDYCYYQFIMDYEKKPRTFKQMGKKKVTKASAASSAFINDEAMEAGSDEDDEDDDTIDEEIMDDNDVESVNGKADAINNNSNILRFKEEHPGAKYADLVKRKVQVIPIMSLAKDSMCRMEELEMETNNPSATAITRRETYAQNVLMLFLKGKYLAELESLDDLKGVCDTYWERFKQARQYGHLWQKGCDILLNIEHRLTAQKMKRSCDPLTFITEDPCDSDDDDNACCNDTKKSKKSRRKDDDGTEITLAHFDEDDERLIDDDYHILEGYNDDTQRTNNHLVMRAEVNHEQKAISARVKSASSILYSHGTESDTTADDSNKKQKKKTVSHGTSTDMPDSHVDRSYPTMLKFISGTLVGDEYDCTNDESSGNDNEDDLLIPDNIEDEGNKKQHAIPTLAGVARKIAEKDGLHLDEKQYMSYEIIACSFLLKLVLEGSDAHSGIAMYLSSSRGEFDQEEKQKLIRKLKARGGQEQLIMYLTGFAGAGKSTCITVAQRFCFEFCRVVSIKWSDRTFFFTATTGSSASLFGGVTIHSAAALNSRGVSRQVRKKWEDVYILVIDEISFLALPSLEKLDKHLRKITGQSNKVYGGMSIIFSGDFHQLPPVMVPDRHILYKGYINGLWEGNLNTVIFLEQSHRFGDDLAWGQVLYRIWRGESTEDDIDLINSRVVGQNDVELPEITVDDDISYACSKNVQRNAISAKIFREHILDGSFPTIDTDELPPDHTIIIEADIQSNTSKGGTTRVNREIRDRMIATCGDASIDTACGKLVDPCLRVYTGCHKMCTNNDKLGDGIGNGTCCRAVKVKLKDSAPPLRWKNWDGVKVYCVSVRHVEWVEFEHFPETREIIKLQTKINETNDTATIDDSDDGIEVALLKEQLASLKAARRFKLTPKKYTATVYCTIDDTVSDTTEFRQTIIYQIPVVDNDGTTGHKLQGMSKDMLISVDWSFQTNWIYVVLSRVRTLKGLFLLKRLPMSALSKLGPSDDLVAHENRLRDIERSVFERRATLMAELESD